MALTGRVLLRAVASHLRTAWWGLVAPVLSETEPLQVVQAVVLRESSGAREVLLSVRSDLHGWELPGGQLEPGEAFEAGLVREVREETGLHVAIERPVGSYVRTGFRPHTALVYTCSVVGGELRPSHETPVLRWFPCGAPPDGLFPWYRKPLEDALAGWPEPVERHEHQGLAAVVAGFRIDLQMRRSGESDGSGDSL